MSEHDEPLKYRVYYNRTDFKEFDTPIEAVQFYKEHKLTAVIYKRYLESNSLILWIR